jgi:type III pantothenate kinase
MDTTLLVDIGNTSLKWALVTGDKWRTAVPVAHKREWSSCFEHLWDELELPGQVLVSNVAGQDAAREFRNWCALHWDTELFFVSSEPLTCGIRNGYRDPQSLGVDRWMSLIGARSVTTAALAVVDCGTAVTVDLLDATNQFVGGAIMPGDQLGRNALNQDTAGISGIERDVVKVLGLSTNECVNSGVQLSIIGGVVRAIKEMEAMVGTELLVLVTGGGAEKIIPRLDVSAQYEPDLVLKGLYEVSRCGS